MSLTGSLTLDIFTALAIILGLVYYYYIAAYTYWIKKNVPQDRPKLPLIEFYKVFTGKTSFSKMINSSYEQFKEHGFGGTYSFNRPTFVACDPELIKEILTKDFATFHDHATPHDLENDPYNANLFNLGGDDWKHLRAKLSPTFTSGKIKGMFPLVNECVQQLKECVHEESKKNNGSVEFQDLLMRYVADVIGTCAFGINCNCLKNPDAEFHHMGREMLKPSFANFINFLIITMCPKLKKYVTTERLFPKTIGFFSGLINNTVKHRRENKVERNDFVQLLMQIQDQETDEKKFNMKVMTANATIFFNAGLDNVGHQLGFCLHAMALDPELQERVYNEVTTVLAEFDGKICYEAVKKMDLVSRVFDEGLRMYTPIGFLMRLQTGDKFKVPGTDVVLDKGTFVIIPMDGLHYDERYFPNPKKFDPDRFTEEEKAKRHPYTYLPFGEGPRFCIASRFAKLEMRLCFAELIHRFEFGVAPETDVSMELEPKSFGPAPKNKFWLKVTERRVK